jgi:glycosyltransferase involved in cell wall biosynthesis
VNVVFSYPSHCVGKPFDPENLWTSPRGMTGSEISFFQYAFGLAKKGHKIDVYTDLEPCPAQSPDVSANWKRFEFPGGGILDLRPQYHVNAGFGPTDACIQWMSPWFMKDWINGPPPFRLYCEQCSDFGNTNWRWEHTVDLFCPLSQTHAQHMSTLTGYPRELYRVMPNGVDLEEFKPKAKVHGKVVWASSHDRGLHHLLSIWPSVRRSVPWASLSVFYSIDGARAFAERREDPNSPNWVNELYRRSNYTLHSLEALRDNWGVEFKGSVSRQQIAQEFATAEVLAYPCDPVRYTETFGSTVLEAMSAGCVPVLCFSDSFKELWGGVCPGVPAPLTPGQLEAFKSVLVGVLTKNKIREQNALECREYASRFAWPLLVDRLERCLETRGREGLDPVAW